MPFSQAFLTSSPLLASPIASTLPQRFRCISRRPLWRAAALGAGASGVRPPDDSSDPSNQQKPFQQPPADPSQTSSESLAEDPSVPPSHPASAISNLGQPDIDIDPVKGVPVSLIDASGALQIDDGSLAASTTILPRRLVKRRPSRIDLQFLRTQLASGFDSGAGATMLLMTLFAIWYGSNTAFNVYNKQVLRVFPFPLTCTVLQFAVAGICMASVWFMRLKKPPIFNRFLLRATLPLAFLHAAGFLLTNMSLGKISVAFTHTVKSTEPFFSVALTPSILGDVPTWGILGSLFPIVAGVALASATEVSFNWIGFLSAVGSNVALQGRNVLSKKLMDVGGGKKLNGKRKREMENMTREEEETFLSLDNVNLFTTMTIAAFFVLAPVCFLWEGFPLLTSAVSPMVTGMSKDRLFKMLIFGGVCRCLDVLSSYMILKRVSPVTHSVGNCVKRAVVISFSLFFFKTTMTSLNIIGTAMALTGVLLYSLIVSSCKQNSFGPDSPFCKPIYETDELELTEGGGI